MCKWIRRLVSYSPLEYLEIVCDDRDQFYGGGPNISYDGLVDHLVDEVLHVPGIGRVGLDVRDAGFGESANLADVLVLLPGLL